MIRRNRKKASLTDLANAAFEQAARKVILLAKQTGTPIIVWKDGQIEEIPSESIDLPAPGKKRTRKSK
jgi:hypothetical protein